MRYITAGCLILASLAAFAADDYREVHELSVTADGLGSLVIDADSGSLDVRGVVGEDSIKVWATIIVDNADEDEGRKFVSKRVELRLDRDDDSARLVARVKQPMLRWGSGGRIDIEVVAPPTVALRIDDGSGPIDVADFVADVSIDDGSGSIDVRSVGNLEIDDGSGSIRVKDVARDLIIIDSGSGSVSFSGIEGTVEQDD